MSFKSAKNNLELNTEDSCGFCFFCVNKLRYLKKENFILFLAKDELWARLMAGYSSQQNRSRISFFLVNASDIPEIFPF